MHILFVASGRRVSLLKAFQLAKKEEDRLICADADDLVPTRNVCDKFYVVPEWRYPIGFLKGIEDIVKLEKIDLIISLMGPATRLLVSDPYLSPKLLSANKELNRIANNKRITQEFFLSCGVNVPKEWTYPDPLHPMIARPLEGYGSRGIYILKSQADIDYFFCKEDTRDYILNTYIGDAEEFTIDCYKDNGQIIAVVPRKRIAVRGGEVLKGKTIQETILINEITNKILPRLDFNGPICIQALKKDMMYYFTEINDRFGGGVPLSFAAGADMPAWIFKHLRGEPIEPLPYFDEVLMLRSDREFYYAPPGIIWEGP